MNISFGGAVLPPATTGHPAALPPDQQDRPERKVAPVDADASARGASAQGQGDAPATPPSAMQRKIMEILDAQAEALEKGQPDPED
ncbi:MAG: hypothetical protein KDK24_08025 [Pseudooceanicola sp.]|nr:hypothetical protein [Pseudooceanicola sp.]